MTTPKLANLYENNELIDLYQIGNDSETDDTNLGFDIPKRITDFNKGFNNAQEFLSLNDSLVNRFPQFQQPVIDYISNNDPKNLNLVVNNLLDPTNNEISGLYSDVGKGLENNLSKFFELPEEERTNILNTLKKRQGIEDDLFWVTSGEPNPELYTKKEVSQNILKKEQPEVTDNVLKYLGVSRFIRNQQKPRTRIKRDNNFKELTGYSFDDVINGRIELDVIESNEFKQGLDAFYNQHKTSIKIPDKSNLSPFTRQLQSFGYEATGSVALAAATSPLLKAGVPGLALFGITNFIGAYLINEKAQDIRKGQTAGIGSQGQASEGEKLAAGFVEMFPIIGDAKGFAGIRKAAIEGGTLTSVETTVRTLIEENRLPNPTEFFTALGVGGLFGGGFKGSLDFFSDLFAKYGGKSAAEIDASLTKKEKTKINKMVEDFETIKDKETKKVEEKVQEIDNLFDNKKTVELPDTRGKGKFYHGSAKEIVLEEGGEAASSQNIYGNGFYTTDDLVTGSGYQNKGKKEFLKPEIPIAKGVKRIGDLPYGIESDLRKLDITDAELNQLVRPGLEVPSADRLRDLARQARQFPIDNPFSDGSRTNVDAFNKIADRLDELANNPPKKPDFKPITYEITEKQPVNFYDLDQPVDAELKTFINNFDDDPFENIVSDAVNDLGDNYTLAQLFDEIREYANGRGVSSNTVIDNIFGNFQEYFTGKGFGGFTHQGGKLAGKNKRLHQVKIYFDSTNQVDIKKVDLNKFARDTKEIPQINPEQVGDKKFTDARVESLINDGSIDSSIKSRTETLDAAIKLKNDPNFQNIVKKIAKDRQANPSDEFQMAIALEITSKNNNILDINQKLLNALNVKNDKEQVNLLTKNFLTEVNKLDEFLTDAIPLRTDQARGLEIMRQSTEGIADMTPEKWNKLTETQKRDWIKLKNGDISVTTDVANKSLKDLNTAVNNALKIYNETGDPKTLNKIFAAVKAAKGDYRKLEKLINYGVLANIANGDVLTKPLMIANEIWLSNILFGIDTHIVNTITAAAETLLVTGNLFLDPKNLFNPRELQVGIQHLMNIHTGFNFALKGAMESFKLESNYFTGSSKLEDFADRFAFSMDGTGFIADLVNGIGKHYLRLPYKALISEDAFLQGININMAAHSGAMLRGLQKGLKGEELKKYVREQADLILETFATKITKRINAVDDPVKKKEAIELYEEVKEFAKRSTFSEDITGGGLINNTTKWLAEGSAKNPLVRRFIPFVRILKNLVGRQVQRTPGIGQLPYLSGFYSDYVNGSPLQRKQLRGQVVFSWLTGAFIWTQMEKYTDPNSDVFLTGGGPTNRTAYSEKWDTGWRPYSVGFKQFNEDGTPKIGEDGNPVIKYYGFTRVDPFSGLLMQYTDAYDISKIVGEGDIEELLQVITVAGARNITDRLFLQGVNDFAKLIYEPKRSQNWLARTVSNNILFVPSSFTRKAKNLPSDLYDMGLLNWTGVTKEQAYQWRLDLDREVYKGDEGLVIGNKVKNELTRTLPGYDNNLPPMREHITNKPIFKRQRPGIDLLTWFEVSESKNDPVLSVFGKLGKGVSDPSDTITSFGRSVGEGMLIETVELDTTDMSDLQFIINTIDSKGRLPGDRGYNGKTIKQAMLKYMETDWFKSNFEIIKNERKPWRTHEDIVNGILNGPPTGKLPGFNDINTKYITAGKDKFLNLNPKVLEKHTKLKKLSRLKYIELLRNANQSVEN